MKNFTEVGKRFDKYMKYKGLGVNDTASILGFSGSQVSNIKNGKVFGSNKLFKILNVFPDLSAEWLITGEGEMLKEPIQSKEPTEELRECIVDDIYKEKIYIKLQQEIVELQKKVIDLLNDNQENSKRMLQVIEKLSDK